MKRRSRILLVTVPVLALGLSVVVTHYWAKAAAERLKARLRAEGEKLSIDEVISVLPTAVGVRNGAPDFLNAYASLLSFDYKLQPVAMVMVQPGRTRIAWMQEELPTRESSNVWPRLRSYVETNAAALAELRAALGRPSLQFRINYHQGLGGFPNHRTSVRGASSVLSAAALLEMHDQHTDKAFANLQALVALPGAYRNEVLPISQLIRYSVLATAAGATWEALQYPHWSDEQLARLLTAWQTISLLPDLESSLAMERALILDEYSKCRESPDRLDSLSGTARSGSTLADLADVGQQLMQDAEEGFEAFVDRFPRRWIWTWWKSYDDEIWFLQSFGKQVAAGRRVARGEPFRTVLDEASAGLRRSAEPPRQFLLGRGLGDFYSQLVERGITAETQRRIVITAIALKQFERHHGKIAGELAALAPNFLKEVPLDPMDGRALRYRATGDKSFVLYSIGVDGKDGGGDSHPFKHGLYWTTCADWVWPEPASAEELRDYHGKLEQERRRKK